jgi:hypothetical protein
MGTVQSSPPPGTQRAPAFSPPLGRRPRSMSALPPQRLARKKLMISLALRVAVTIAGEARARQLRAGEPAAVQTDMRPRRSGGAASPCPSVDAS